MSKPFLSVTGTIDNDVMSMGSSPKKRAALFDEQANGDKYRVVFEGGDHSAFGGGDVREAAWLNRVTGENHESTNLATVRVIREKTRLLTLKFLDAYLKGDSKAKTWLAEDAKVALGDAGVWSAK